MNHPRKSPSAGILLTLVSFVGLLSGSAHGQSSASLPVQPIEYEKETLDNGLRVIYAPMRQAPVVHVRVLYHVGSRDEKPDRQGFAHMFEHMMFRGSAHVASEQHMKMIGVVGGNSNAFTSSDQTTYINTIPTNAVEMALYLEADRMASFKVNQAVYSTERDVVSEEWRMRYGNPPTGFMWMDFLKTAYTTHNYRWPTIGDMDQLRQATTDELQEFFNTYYVPNNACLIVAGDIDIPKTKEWIRKYYGWIPRGPEITRLTKPEPDQTAPRSLIVHKPNVPLTNIYLGFKTTDYRSDDHYALAILADILSSGRTGRLDRRFVNSEDPPCLEISALDYQLQDQSLFIVDTIVQQGKDPAQVEKDILATIYEVAEKGVTQEELDKVRTQWRQALVRSRQTCTAIATELGEEEVFGGDAARVNQILPRIDALTPAQLQAIAKKYFTPARLTSVQYRPETAGTPTARATLAASVQAVAAAPSTIAPRVTSFPPAYPTQPPPVSDAITAKFNKGTEATVAGIKVITLTDKRLPLVNISLIMPGGSDSENPSKVALGGLTAQMMRRGSAGMAFLDFSNDLESRGISIDASDSSDTTRLQVSCTTDQLDHAVMRANQVLAKPDFPVEEFDKLKRQHIGGLVGSLSDPAYVADRELRKAVYEGSTLGRLTTQKTLEAITHEDIKNWYQTFYQLEGAFLVVSGDVTPEQSAQIATRLLAGLDRRKQPAKADYALTSPPQQRRILLVDNPEGRQASIRMAIRAYDIHTDEKFAGTISGNILSAGIESRLNRYVRAEKGLTYGCRAYFQPSRHSGEFTGSVDTNPNTTAEAILAMIKVFTDMRSADVTPQELADAKSRVAGGMVMEMQRIDQQASRRIDQILNGYPIDYYDRYPQHISQVTRDQVRQVMDKYVKDDRMVFIVVAPASSVKEQLEKLGTVQVIPMPLKRDPAQ